METKRFETELLALLPRLRAYAIALTGGRSAGDDLLQDTIVRAWRFRERFEESSNMSAWTHKIMRNSYYSSLVSNRRFVSDVDGAYAAKAACEPEQEWRLKYSELMAALQRLSAISREALLLVVAEGRTYEEAAEIAECPAGTMKSRVNRARQRLAELTGLELPSADRQPAASRAAPKRAAARQWESAEAHV